MRLGQGLEGEAGSSELRGYCTIRMPRLGGMMRGTDPRRDKLIEDTKAESKVILSASRAE